MGPRPSSSSAYGSALFTGATSITSASTAAARFEHKFAQTPSSAYDDRGDHFFLGQISGAGLLAWDNAKSATGTPDSSFTLSTTLAAWSQSVANDSLYAAGNTVSGDATIAGISIWRRISNVSAATAPTLKLEAASGIAAHDFIEFVDVLDGELVACIQSGKVLIWKDAASIAAEGMPSSTLTGLSDPKKAVKGSGDRMYVLEADGISIFKNVSTTPALVVKITDGVSQPADLTIVN
jgi:hypothetical protein